MLWKALRYLRYHGRAREAMKMLRAKNFQLTRSVRRHSTKQGWLVGCWLLFGWLVGWLVGGFIHHPRRKKNGRRCSEKIVPIFTTMQLIIFINWRSYWEKHTKVGVVLLLLGVVVVQARVSSVSHLVCMYAVGVLRDDGRNKHYGIEYQVLKFVKLKVENRCMI